MSQTRKLNSDVIQQLRNSGFSDQEIGEFMFGEDTNATPHIMQALTKISKGQPAMAPHTMWAGSKETNPVKDAMEIVGPTLRQAAPIAGMALGAGAGTIFGNPALGGNLGKWLGGAGTTRIPGQAQISGSGRLKNTIDELISIGRNATGLRRNLAQQMGRRAGQTPGGAGGAGGGLPDLPEIDYGGYPTAPGPYDYQYDPIVPGDFTDIASEIINRNMAPAIGAYDTLTANAQTQGANDIGATQGLYENYIKNIAETKVQGDTEYDQRGAEAGQRGQDVVAQMGQNMASSNANVAGELQRLGLQAAAPENLQQAANDTTFAQNQAVAGTADEQQYYDAQQQARSDFMGTYGNIAESQGLHAQGDLRAQLANILAEIGQNKANLQSSVGQAATDLALKMQQQDLAAQEANQGASLQTQQLEAAEPWKVYGAQVDAYGNNISNQQNDIENMLKYFQLGDTSKQGWATLDLNRDIAESKAGGSVNPPSAPAGGLETLDYANYLTGDTRKGTEAVLNLNKLYLDFINDPVNEAGTANYSLLKSNFMRWVNERVMGGIDPGVWQQLAGKFFEDQNKGNQSGTG